MSRPEWNGVEWRLSPVLMATIPMFEVYVVAMKIDQFTHTADRWWNESAPLAQQ